MPIASVRSLSDAPSKPRFQKISIARSSASSRSKERGRPRGLLEVSSERFIVTNTKLLDSLPQAPLHWRRHLCIGRYIYLLYVYSTTRNSPRGHYVPLPDVAFSPPFPWPPFYLRSASGQPGAAILSAIDA